MGRKPFNPSLISASASPEPASSSGFLTVSQLTRLVQQAIKTAVPPTVHVVGEISNLKRHSSGHLYFTMKDAGSELSCVMWRSDAKRLKFEPADGLEVIATGGVDVFERSGRYQLYVRRIEPRGVGELELAFRQLHDRLEREGLFDDRHKKPLPSLPMRLCVITSPTGAAIVDILRTVERRCPIVSVLVYPVRVQGEGAGREIAAAIGRINRKAAALGGVDAIIIGRGGGSLEDLWAFNEECVARAIFASSIAIVSAVGHEVDVTIADLVADVRAATPTAAAELTVPMLDELVADVRSYSTRMSRALTSASQLWSARLAATLQRSAWRDPAAMLHRREQVLDELCNRQSRGLHRRLREARMRLEALEPIVARLEPRGLLLRSTVTLRDLGHRLQRSMGRRLTLAERGWMRAVNHRMAASPAMPMLRCAQRLDRAAERLPASLRGTVAALQQRIDGKEELLGALGCRSVLRRGFSITRLKKGRQVVRSVSGLRDYERITTELADGEFEADVVNRNQMELFDQP